MIRREGRRLLKNWTVYTSLAVIICGMNFSGADNTEKTSTGTEILKMIPIQSDGYEGNKHDDFLLTDVSETEAVSGTALGMLLNKPDGKADSENAAEKQSGFKSFRIYGPEKMRAGTKKYYKPLFDEEKPRRYKVSWFLDCDKKIAQVFRNGQVWVTKKAKSGTVLKLTCRVEGKDAKGLPWIGEAAMEIEIK